MLRSARDPVKDSVKRARCPTKGQGNWAIVCPLAPVPYWERVVAGSGNTLACSVCPTVGPANPGSWRKLLGWGMLMLGLGSHWCMAVLATEATRDPELSQENMAWVPPQSAADGVEKVAQP